MGLSPFTKSTAEKVSFGAGIIVMNLTDPRSFDGTIPTGAKLLGATNGGSSFSEEMEMIDALEGADGYDMPVLEAQKITKRIGTLTTQALEQTAEVLKLALGAADLIPADSEGSMDTIQPRTELRASDFVSNICVIAPMLKEGTYSILELDNSINTNGLSVTFGNNEKGTIDLELKAFSTLENYGRVPFRIHTTKVAVKSME